MIFFVNRFTLQAFGLAVAVKEFAAVLTQPQLVARRVNSDLLISGNLRRLPAWRALLSRGQAWHMNDLFAPICILMTLIGLLTGRAVIICPHGMLDRWALRQSRFRAKLAVLALFDACARVGRLSVHALTPVEQRKARFFLPHAKRNVVVPNGIPSDIMARQEELRTQSARAPRDGTIVIGVFSRISPKKNQLAMVHLAVLLRDTRPKVFEQLHFCIDGQVEDAAYMQRIRAAVAEANLEERFSFSGPVPFEKRGQVLAGYDIFFFPSLSEGMPYVVLEAMALDVLPIAAQTAACAFTRPYGAVIYHDLASAARAIPANRAALDKAGIDHARFIEHYGDARLRHFMALFEATS